MSESFARRRLEFQIGAGVAFLAPLILFLRTVAPTTSYWDCGEFIACSYTMGIPHPPGAPMFIMIGRVFSLIPFFDIGYRVNLISVFSSALTVLLLYLIIVRLFREWRGLPETFRENLIVITAALFGALSFAVTDTFWFNAVEAEVYALSTLFTALVLWMALLWMDFASEDHSIRFLVMIGYVFCLSIGLHLLNLLVIPSILLMFWFAKPQIFRGLEVLGVGVLLYLVLPAPVNLMVIPAVVLFMLFVYPKGELWKWGIATAVIGVSVYLMIYIRSGLDPIIDQNNPETLQNFMSYIRRDQYGTQSLFTTIFDRVAPLWDYQINKMYLRYVGWQFIGKGTTIGADRFIVESFSLNGLYGLPFVAGLMGCYYHFRKDWRNALMVLVLFVMTGVAIVIYLNQPDPQPRERDYVYVGSYMAFCIWIAYGLLGLLDTLSAAVAKRPHIGRSVLAGTAALVFLAVPGNMLLVNFHEHDRSGLYLAWDYSYNILNSCEPNAILFTNGDNDTFPLWYLQEVEGIRQDVNIVNLSLINTSWYILQVKNGARPVALGMTDEQIRSINLVRLDEPQQMRINVPADRVKAYMPEMADIYPALGTKDEVLEWELAPTYAGKYLRVQDRVVLQIIYSNEFRRPIYFAVTVAPSNFLGLREYFRLDGLAYKLLPIKAANHPMVHAGILSEKLNETFKYRCTNDPDTYYNLNNKTLLQNYRNAFMQLAGNYLQNNQQEEAAKALERMEELVPEWRVPIGNQAIYDQMVRMWLAAGRPDRMTAALQKMAVRPGTPDDKLYEYAQLLFQFGSDTTTAIEILDGLVARTPSNGQWVGYLSNMHERQQDYGSAVRVLETWLKGSPQDSAAIKKMAGLRRLQLADSGATP